MNVLKKGCVFCFVGYVDVKARSVLVRFVEFVKAYFFVMFLGVDNIFEIKMVCYGFMGGLILLIV